jgi:hypothetical protein
MEILHHTEYGEKGTSILDPTLDLVSDQIHAPAAIFLWM